MKEEITKTPRIKKKKVSFDIDPGLLERIKSIILSRDMKLADFFREAAENKLEIEEKYIVIYVSVEGKGIQKLIVERSLYITTFKEASKDMKDNVGAVQEGSIELLKDREALDRFYENLQIDVGEGEPVLDYSMYINSTLQNLFEDKDVVYFFTKIRY